jgi:cell division protein FtsB
MVVITCLSLAVLVGLAVVPVRTWLSQKEKTRQAEAEISRIDQDIASLERQLDELQTDAEIERRARQDFDLVFPGEESYRILPSEPEPGDG